MSAPIGPLHLAGTTGHFTKGDIWLKVNGQIKQNSNLANMLSERLGKIHFWITFVGSYAIYYPMHYLGFMLVIFPLLGHASWHAYRDLVK